GKRPQTGRNVSHAHNRTLRKFNPNLQSVRAECDGKPLRMTEYIREYDFRKSFLEIMHFFFESHFSMPFAVSSISC
ncbi:MAG TPA: 50S ribosomal protein L28, partial [candidate division Zixibacteria bacterium]|nr:50S ribosomal protein L28 [candidate division Zixibacteria bacterium]